MMKTVLISKLILASIFVLGSTGVFAQGVSEVAIGEHVDAQLVAETEHAVPGESLWVALRLDHMEHWHTYWKNPGDAGKPTVISWQLPEGFRRVELSGRCRSVLTCPPTWSILAIPKKYFSLPN